MNNAGILYLHKSLSSGEIYEYIGPLELPIKVGGVGVEKILPPNAPASMPQQHEIRRKHISLGLDCCNMK